MELVEASARGDADRIVPPSVEDWIGVDKRRFVEDTSLSSAADGGDAA